MKYWKAREKHHELMDENHRQQQQQQEEAVAAADKTPRERIDFSTLSEDDRICLFAYQSESGQSTPNVLSPKQPPTIGPVRNPRMRTLLPNTAFSYSPHSTYSRALAGNTNAPSTISTPTTARLGVGYGYERQVFENASSLGPPFGGNQNICAYPQQFQEPPPAYQSPVLGGISDRQTPSTARTPSPTPPQPNVSAPHQPSARTPTQMKYTNPFVSPDEVHEQSTATPRNQLNARTPISSTLALPTVNEDHDFLEASRSRSCPNFSGILDDPPHLGSHPPTSTPFRRDEKQGLLAAGDYLDDPELNITTISSIGSRLYDIHIEASRDEDPSFLEYPPTQGTTHASGGGTGGIMKRFSSGSDIAGFFC